MIRLLSADRRDLADGIIKGRSASLCIVFDNFKVEDSLSLLYFLDIALNRRCSPQKFGSCTHLGFANNIFILYSAKSMYSSKRFTIKRCDIASLKLIRNVKCANNIQYSG